MADYKDDLKQRFDQELKELTLSQARKDAIKDQMLLKLKEGTQTKKVPFAALRSFWNRTYEVNLGAAVAVCLALVVLTPTVYLRSMLSVPEFTTGEQIAYVETITSLPDGSIRVVVDKREGN